MTNQETRQQNIRDITSTAHNTSSDWHALFDDAGIAAGTFNERMLAWINDSLGTSYTNVSGAMAAFAADQGFTSWASISPLSLTSLSFTIPAAYFYLTSASPYDIGSTLQIADSEDVGGDYTLAITLTGGGTLTLAGTTGLTGSGDGTSSLSYSGTIAEWNTALDGADIAGLSDETATMSLTLTRDADSSERSTSVPVTAYPALAISSLAPPDNSTDTLVDRPTYTATFNRDIQEGTGDIVLKVVGGSTLETFNIATGAGDDSGLVAVTGAQLVISPGSDLAGETEHAIRIASTAIDGADIGTGDSFAGIADDTTWSFTTADVDAPTISTLDPADGSTDHPIADSLVATFSENIAFGTGDIRLVRTGVGTIETFNVATELGDDSGSVSISTNTLTIDPGSSLVDTVAYHVEIDSTAIEDAAGNTFAGIADATTWNFAAADATNGAKTLVDTWTSDTQGFGMVFEDAAGTLPPSIYVKDTGTPANDTELTITDFFSDFNDFLTYTSPSPKIVRQSDGDLKYCAHNLYLNSASPANQSITVVSGHDYAVTITGSVSVTASGAATGTWTAGTNTFTAATTTLTPGLYVRLRHGSRLPHARRQQLLRNCRLLFATLSPYSMTAAITLRVCLWSLRQRICF